MIPEKLLPGALREFNRSVRYCSLPFHVGLYLLAVTGGLPLLELVVNAMEDVEPGLLEWEWRQRRARMRRFCPHPRPRMVNA